MRRNFGLNVIKKYTEMLFGEKGDNALYANKSNVMIFGNAGNDFLVGSDGNDFIQAGRGADWLYGGQGNDKLMGGRGDDTFHFNIMHDANGVKSQGIDKIQKFHKDDTLSFGGDIKSLQDLQNAVDKIYTLGNTLKIKFKDGGKILIYGFKGGKISTIDELNDKINIEFNHEYRNIDGTSNNNYDDYMGGAYTQFLRLAPSAYKDGLNSPAGDNRPSAREISNEIFAQSESVPNEFNASDLFWLWGQFVDHDIDLIEGFSGEDFSIAVPLGDIYFDPFYTGTATIMLTRSGFDSSTGIDTPREHINAITAYLDASVVYGSDDERASFLRTEDGKLKTSTGNLMPYNDGNYENAPNNDTNMFLAGDIRANENIGLTSMHTLFVREHNRWVDILSQEHPEYSGEQLYQEARVRVEAIIQQITYTEFLPLLLGESAITAYSGYQLDVNPGISNTFAAAAYRLGHTLLSTEIERLQENGDVFESHLALQNAFFRPDLLQQPEQIEAIMRGMAQGQAESIDTQIVDDVRNFLFGPPGAGGFDLAALNIQRGRDHGLADYNTTREAFGLAKVETFAEITSNVELQAKLASLYNSVDNIDVFVGGLAEDAVAGSMLGELFQTIVADQFTRIRDGDRLWYENRLDQDTLADVQQLNLADIIELNSGVEIIQNNPFVSHTRIGGDDTDNVLIGTASSDLIIGFAGDDLLTGGLGADQFALTEGAGHDTITDFTPGEDQLDLTNLNTNYNNLSFVNMANSVLVQISANELVTLQDMDLQQLNVNDFVF